MNQPTEKLPLSLPALFSFQAFWLWLTAFILAWVADVFFLASDPWKTVGAGLENASFLLPPLGIVLGISALPGLFLRRRRGKALAIIGLVLNLLAGLTMALVLIAITELIKHTP
jgi:hypothetical protein